MCKLELSPLPYRDGGFHATFKLMYIGAHVSIAGGFEKCVERASAFGVNTLQTFASSPRSLKFRAITDSVIESYKRKKTELRMGPHFFHGVYLVNLASEKTDYVRASVESLIFYQGVAGKIGGEGTIFHIGSHKGVGFEKVRGQIVAALESILGGTPDGVKLFLENAAGHAGVVGDTFEELGWLIKSLSSEAREKVAVCVDTQHAFATGYDLRRRRGIVQMLDDFDKQIGLIYLKVIHANDSKVNCGEKRDRHENIGEGFMGSKSFSLLLHHPKLKNLPFILEVPGENKSGPRKVDVDKLKSLA